MKASLAPSILLTILLLCGAAQARQTNWRCIAGGENQLSHGAAMTSSHIFELGYFGENFVPTSSNSSEWANHWIPVDRTVYREQDRAFSDSFLMEPGGSQPTITMKAYIWGFNANEEAGEWILVSRADWTWPIPSPSALPHSWVVTNSAEVVLGTVNRGQ